MDFFQLLRAGAFFFIFGLAAGYLLRQLIGGMSDRRKRRDPAAPEAEPDDRVEILRIWKHKETGQMLVDLQKRPLPPADQLSDIQRKKVTSVMVALSRWIGMKPKSTPAPAKPAPQTPRPAPRKTSPLPRPTAPPPQTATQTTPPASPTDRALPPLKLEQSFADELAENPTQSVSLNPFRRPKANKTEKDPVLAPKSVVEQINDVLQNKIAGTSFETLGVKMAEDAKGMMQITVGTKVYSAVDDVQEADVKQMIKAAANEWNQSQSQRKYGSMR